jgi:3-isopropylmalate dehydrogenase
MTKKIYKIAVLPGDGIGIEIVREADKVLQAISHVSGVIFDMEEGLVGGAAYDHCGEPLPAATMDLSRKSDVILLGAVGGPRWESLDYSVRPERALLGLRGGFDLFANLRPVVAYEELIDASPLKRHVVQDIDIMVVRELTGDVYFGQPRGIRIENGSRIGVNTLIYTEEQIRRIAVVAFDMARKRRKNVVSVDKANILESSQLWRDVVTEVGCDYPDVTLRHLYVDNCAMQLLLNPLQFDVIVTSNMFGDILSDEAAVLSGSIGMLPSASHGPNKSLYEPIHGSAPDIAGKNTANPLATVLSVAMMLRHSFNMSKEAALVERAVKDVLKNGFRTRDIHREGTTLVRTDEMGNRVVEKIHALSSFF